MNDIYENAQDEQLLLLMHHNDVAAFYSLYRKCMYYAKGVGSELQKNFVTAIYDEGEFNECLSECFNNATKYYDFTSAFFKNYFIRLFRHEYTKVLKEHMEKDKETHSLDELISPYHNLTYSEVLHDNHDYYKEYYELVTSREIISSVQTKVKLSPKAKTIVIYRMRGYSNIEIGKMLNLKSRTVSHVFNNPLLKKAIKQIVLELREQFIPKIYLEALYKN